MGNQVTSARKSLNLWKRDATPDRSPANHGRNGTVGGGLNCAADTEVSKQSDVGQNETMVGSSKVVVGHSGAQRGATKKRQMLLGKNTLEVLQVMLALVT